MEETVQRNYKCKIDFKKLRNNYQSGFIEFVMSLCERDPVLRLSAAEALENELFQEKILDEGSGFLSKKFRNTKTWS